MIPSLHRSYVFLSAEDVEMLRRIGWYRGAVDTVRGIFPELSSSFVAKIAIARASSVCGIVFFCAKKVDLMHRGFAVLPGWEDTFALSKKVLTQHMPPPTFPLKIVMDPFGSCKYLSQVRKLSVWMIIGRCATLS